MRWYICPNKANFCLEIMAEKQYNQTMKYVVKFTEKNNWVSLQLLLFLLVLFFFPHVVSSGQIVKTLPGFDGELPFTLETGSTLQSEGNPKEDPLLPWYGGGPGCSAFNGLIYEIGPLAFNITEYEGGTPTLEYYPYSWTQWLIDHPKYLKNQLFIGADSYSGITAPIVVQHILEGNAVGERPRLNLKETKITCSANYYDVDPNQAECFESLQKIANLIHDINKNDILEPKCTWASPDQNGETDRRSLEQQSGNFILSPPKIPEMWCHNFNFALSYIWANDESVQQALYVTEGTVKDWKRCNKNLDYTLNVETVLDVHKNLSSYGLQVLVYNGDHDLTIPNTGTQDWIKLLNLTIVGDWRPWLVDGEVGGEQGTHLKSTSVENVMRCTKAMIMWLCVLVLMGLCNTVVSKSLIKSLPGFPGESEDVQLFYYFIESERNPSDDPLMLWLTGGPGCSALSGLIYEVGVLAVKKINSSALPNHLSEDFMDIVSDASRLRHPNITELVGYCSEHGQHLLVYEFHKNGSLYDFLHLSDEFSKPLTWNTRVKIALGTARAQE
ncbi:unnamed protein product [Camellia sinensis]